VPLGRHEALLAHPGSGHQPPEVWETSFPTSSCRAIPAQGSLNSLWRLTVFSKIPRRVPQQPEAPDRVGKNPVQISLDSLRRLTSSVEKNPAQGSLDNPRRPTL
jgi:hypothetical protein